MMPSGSSVTTQLRHPSLGRKPLRGSLGVVPAAGADGNSFGAHQARRLRVALRT